MALFKSIFFVFLAILATGCAARQGIVGGPMRRVPMMQVGVLAHVVNNCAAYVDLERDGRVEISRLPFGGSARVALPSLPFSGWSRDVFLVAKGYNTNGRYVGSFTQRFWVNIQQGSREEVWEITQLNLPGGRGGCH